MKDLGWKPNRLSPVPLHRQIEEYIKGKILNGEWTIGTKIPSQRQLADSLCVNRSTVVTALDELTAQGLLEGKKGGGTKVINNTWSLLAANPPLDWNSYVRSGIHHPNLPTVQEINRAEFYPDMIRLGTGELSPELLPYKQMQNIWDRLSVRMMSLGYEEPKGDLFLRQAVTEHLKNIGIHTSPSSVLIVSGALQALQLISIGLLHRGSSVLLEKPSYLYSVHVFQSAGMKLVGVPMDEQGIQTSFLPRYRKQYGGALLYSIPSFHNPTGILMTENRRKDLLTTCEQERLPIVEDDVYRDLWMDCPPPMPLKANDKNGNVLYVGSLSKTVSPGLRIGWVVGPEPVIERLADIKMQTDYGSSSLSQWAAAEWLSSGLYQEHLSYIRRELKSRRDATIDLLQKHFGNIASWNVPKGGFYIWLRFIPSIPIRELFEKALKEGILLNPGNVYDRDTTQYIRISCSYASLSDMEYGLARLSIIIRDLMNKCELPRT
ncbi:PLP-dependent aminotransferase family protein [Ectobacillus panaciterrae]|uniref:aminotransferase-like domain-containing protein n=1 Tax=Ectobacillus panaciterrae TaxID=363872 RepID=UPI00040BAC0C|nr:PLP-dependent aminotransferase family protein [Ectobacillus panaciterrae]